MSRSAPRAAELDQRRHQRHPGLRSLRLADRLLQQPDRLIAIVLAQAESHQRRARCRRRAEGSGHAYVVLGQAQGFVALLGSEQRTHCERRPVRGELGPRSELADPAVTQLGQLAQGRSGLAERQVEACPSRPQEPEPHCSRVAFQIERYRLSRGVDVPAIEPDLAEHRPGHRLRE